MDDFVDQFFVSSSTDGKASQNLSWVGNGLDLTNGLLTNTIEPYKGNENTLPSNLIPSDHIVDNLITDGPSVFVGGNSSFDLDHQTLLSLDLQPPQGDVDANSKPVYMAQQMRRPSTLGILNYGSPELLHVALDPTNSLSAQPISVSVGSSQPETSEIQDTLRTSYAFASHPQVQPRSLRTSVMLQDKLHGFRLQGQCVQTNDAVMGNNYFAEDVLQGNLPALLSVNGEHKLNCEYLSSFAAADHIPLGRTADMHCQMQLNEGNYIKHYADQSQISQPPHSRAVGSYNRAVKPRVRARRGQATDPHSIAERLRRERIADRIKNLQKLVPNSNKTEKAPMLDEIIDYVKFLQLQVKVLSMSRLGATEAVLPLITDSQAEGSAGLLLSQPAGQGVDPFETTCNEVAFEQEVVKLMESNMTKAVQLLQSKGLCLMPLALAAAIPSSKASSSICIPTEGKLHSSTNGLVHQENSQPSRS